MLTTMVYEAERNSFNLSDMGATGYTRFFRKQSFMVNNADVFPIDAFDEGRSE